MRTPLGLALKGTDRTQFRWLITELSGFIPMFTSEVRILQRSSMRENGGRREASSPSEAQNETRALHVLLSHEGCSFPAPPSLTAPVFCSPQPRRESFLPNLW